MGISRGCIYNKVRKIRKMGGAEIKFFEEIEKMLKKVEKIIFESHDKGKENTVVLQGTGRPRFFFFRQRHKTKQAKKEKALLAHQR